MLILVLFRMLSIKKMQKTALYCGIIYSVEILLVLKKLIIMNKRPRQTGKNGSSDASLMELNYGSPQRHLHNSPQGYYDEE